MNFELGKEYIVTVTDKGIVPIDEFDRERFYDKDNDDLDFLTDEEKTIIENQAYKKGIDDAWGAAKKIILGVNHGGLADDEIMTIFNKPFTGVLVENTATEVVTKIKEYEDKQKQTKNCLNCKWDYLYYEKLNVSEDEKLRHCNECYKNSGYESIPTKSCSILEDVCPYIIECEECEVHCSIERARKKLKESNQCQ